jgi:hypothetical protein
VLKLGLVKEKIGKIMTRCDPADQAGWPGDPVKNLVGPVDLFFY